MPLYSRVLKHFLNEGVPLRTFLKDFLKGFLYCRWCSHGNHMEFGGILYTRVLRSRSGGRPDAESCSGQQKHCDYLVTFLRLGKIITFSDDFPPAENLWQLSGLPTFFGRTKKVSMRKSSGTCGHFFQHHTADAGWGSVLPSEAVGRRV